MVIGIGKIFIGFGGVVRLCEIINDKLVVIIVCLY